MNLLDFRQACSAINISLTDAQITQFSDYLEGIKSWNDKMDLTALKNDEEIIEKHFFDSLLIAPWISSEKRSLADVGSGAGFPGIPLKICFPSLKVTLIEPTTKRTRFLEAMIAQLHLADIFVINARAEDFVHQARESFNYVTARAVAPLPILCELCLPLLANGGTMIAMKGPQANEEIKASSQALVKLKSHISVVHSQTLPSQGEVRNNVFIIKDGEISKKFPRPYAEIKRKPL